MRLKVSTKNQKLLITLLAAGLGNLLAYLSTSLVSIQPQVAFDLSHLATFTVALYFGPYYGLLAGATVAIYPYVRFGVLGIYGPAVGLAIIMGKAMTGLFCGILAGRLRPYLAVAISFIPEFLFTFVFLKAVQTWMLPDVLTWSTISEILLKEWVEVLILSFILETITRVEVMETAVLLLEIFIITLLIPERGSNTFVLLLAMVLLIITIVDIVKRQKEARNQANNSKQ